MRKTIFCIASMLLFFAGKPHSTSSPNSSIVPPAFRSNTPSIVLTEHANVYELTQSVYGLKDKDWATSYVTDSTGTHRYWTPSCLYENHATIKGNNDLTHYDLVLYRGKNYIGLLKIEIYDSVGTLKRTIYKTSFDFDDYCFQDDCTPSHSNDTLMSISFHRYDNYFDNELINIDGVSGLTTFLFKWNYGNVYHDQHQNIVTSYVAIVDATGVRLIR